MNDKITKELTKNLSVFGSPEFASFIFMEKKHILGRRKCISIKRGCSIERTI